MPHPVILAPTQDYYSTGHNRISIAGFDESIRSKGADALLEELQRTCSRLLAVFASTPTKPASSPASASSVQPVAHRSHHADLSANLRRMLQFRSKRRRHPSGQFLDWPAWDMLLDLAATRVGNEHVSVSSVCISSGAPQSTALRKLAALESAKLVHRYVHGPDRRRVCVALTDEAFHLVMTTLEEEMTFYHGIGTPG